MPLGVGFAISPSFSGGISSPYLVVNGQRLVYEAPQVGGIFAPSTLPAWLAYTRASGQGSVQTGASTVYTGAGDASNDYYPIGRVNDSDPYGLFLEPAVTNLWGAGSRAAGIGLESAGVTITGSRPSPDGQNLAVRHQLSTASQYHQIGNITGSPTVLAYTLFVRTETAGKDILCLYDGTSFLARAAATGNNLSSTWQLLQRYWSGTGFTSMLGGFNYTGTANGYGNVSSNDVTTDFPMLQKLFPHYSSWHNTSRTLPLLDTTSGYSPSSGNLIFEIDFIALCSCGAGKPNPAGTGAVLLRDGAAGVYMQFDTTTGVLSGSGGAISGHTTNIAFDMFDRVRLCLVFSATDSRSYYKINGGSVVASASLGNKAWPYTGNLRYTSSTLLPRQIIKTALYKSGFLPSWVQ